MHHNSSLQWKSDGADADHDSLNMTGTFHWPALRDHWKPAMSSPVENLAGNFPGDPALSCASARCAIVGDIDPPFYKAIVDYVRS